MPPVFVVRPSGAARSFARASVDFALAQTSRVSSYRIAAPPRIPQLLLTEVLAIHLAHAPAAELGLFRALRDPVLAPALAAIHAAPQAKWNLIALAQRSRVSVSQLGERFRDVLGGERPACREVTYAGARSSLAAPGPFEAGSIGSFRACSGPCGGLSARRHWR